MLFINDILTVDLNPVLMEHEMWWSVCAVSK